MLLRFFCAAAFVARLRYRRVWRVAFLRWRCTTLSVVVARGARRGLTPVDAVQEALQYQLGPHALRPRYLLHQDELENSPGDEGPQ